MKIGIVGAGVVGSATATAFRDHVDEVRCWDGKEERRTHSLHDTVRECDLVFVCLPTPQKTNSLACDLEAVDMFFNSMSRLQPDANFVLRSTVPVGTTRMLREKYGLYNLVHSPEFLTARTAKYDACNPTRMVIGGEVCDCRTVLARLYDKVFGTDILSCDKFVMTSDESEFVKLMQNAFSAVKVAAFNEFRSFSDVKGLDWERCLAALLAGGWINPQHTNVPGPDGKRGFGGSCLPKDTNNLISCGEDAGVAMLMAQAAMLRNKFDRGEG